MKSGNRKKKGASHANMCATTRVPKAWKIVHVLGQLRSLRGASVLEIGTGSGVISSVLADAVDLEGSVTSVDVVDERQTSAGFEFVLVSSPELPFENQSFDFAVSNHVIEHVGGRAAQLLHVQEIARVLKQDGYGYIAVPNKWSIFEPHFKLPFLSYLPRRLANLYVRITRRGDGYDCNLLGRGELLRLVEQAGLCGQDITEEVLEVMIANGELNHLGKLPYTVRHMLFKMGRTIVPTNVVLLSPVDRRN